MVLLLLPFLAGCSDDASGVRTFADFDVVLENSPENEPYRYVISLNEGDTAILSKQGENFEISELRKDTVNRVGSIFTYKPKAGFTGTDEIEIEKQYYTFDPEPQLNKALIKIRINVEKGF